MNGVPATEGRIPFGGYQTWYRIVGEREESGRVPVLCLHGGPGATHDYLEPFEALASTGRRIIFYDQLGSGRSAVTAPHDSSMWSTELYVREVDAVREALGLDRVHLLGQSWGGMLAMEYALTQPEGLRGLVIESAPASMIQWVSEANHLRQELPREVQATLLAHEAAGTTDTQEYQDANIAFMRRHVCRVDPFPACLQRTLDAIDANPEVYHTMNGPSEFHVVGTLRDWDITERLGEIGVPSLILSGRFDEATPAIAETVHKGIRGSEWVLFENSSHVCHIEETERCLAVVSEFLERVEREG
jgi:proline-specific peptidase